MSMFADIKDLSTIVARPHGLPLTELLVDGVYPGRYNIKTRLVRSGLKRNT
jgi:hypothetical protein